MGQPLYRIPPQQPGWHRIAQPEQEPQGAQVHQRTQHADVAVGQSQCHEFDFLFKSAFKSLFTICRERSSAR
ncbi:hypothetical protein D3C85_1874560 [compost metagenome]